MTHDMADTPDTDNNLFHSQFQWLLFYANIAAYLYCKQYNVFTLQLNCYTFNGKTQSFYNCDISCIECAKYLKFSCLEDCQNRKKLILVSSYLSQYQCISVCLLSPIHLSPPLSQFRGHLCFLTS